jgi:hypothetical protein
VTRKLVRINRMTKATISGGATMKIGYDPSSAVRI